MSLRENPLVRTVAVAVSLLPSELYFPRRYRAWARFLDESEYWSREQLQQYQLKKLRAMLHHCAIHVPYYRSLFRRIGFDPAKLERLEQIQGLPILDRDAIMADPEQFLAENIPAIQRRYFTTGGTMGRPMGLYNLRGAGWREQAFMFHQWKRVNFHPSARRAMLRGRAIKNKRHWEYDPYEKAYFFSNFHMTENNAAEYARVMKSKKLNFLHSYPSAVLDFARHLRSMGIEPPGFRAILLSSENMYPGQREMIESFFQCRAFSWYGHSENLALAGECEYSTNYHLFPQYGYVELIREDGSLASKEGDHAEIVGTALDNTAMPLVRYRTGDWATVGPQNCRCGRNFPLLAQAHGRWHQEMLVGRNGNLVSMTAINVHNDAFDRVRQFQFRQTQEGKVVLRIVRGPGYSDADTRKILDTLLDKMGDSMEIELEFVEQIPLTERGKFRFIVQELTIPISRGGVGELTAK